MRKNSKTSHSSSKYRSRTISGSSLSPRDELLRESIRYQVASEPYQFMTPEETWREAIRLAKSLEKDAETVRKAIYNRRHFVNKKIADALVKFEIIDVKSPVIHEIAEIAQTIAINVVHFLESHYAKICKQIMAKSLQQKTV